MNTWKRRHLTPLGRIPVLKTLILSKITHLFLLIPNPREQFMKEMTHRCYNSMWNGSSDRIKWDATNQQVAGRGLDMLEMPMVAKSLKITWMRRLFTTEANWKYLTEYGCRGTSYVVKFGNDHAERCGHLRKLWKVFAADLLFLLLFLSFSPFATLTPLLFIPILSIRIHVR